MRGLMALLMACCSGMAGAAEVVDDVIAQVQARDVALAEAHGRGDMQAYRAGVSDRYVYIDTGGKRVTADMLAQRRADDARRVVSSQASEDEAIRLSDTVVLLRGLERSVATYYGGLPRASASRWSALWVREGDGVWRLTADTATPVKESEALPFVHVPQPEATLAAHTGRWALALDPPMELMLAEEKGALVGTLSGQPVRFTFRPASATHFFADERPFELRFAADGQGMTLVTWGTSTAAMRVADD